MMASDNALYRFYDAADQLLYVGVTKRLGARFREHSKSAPWWGPAVRSTVQFFDTYNEAIAAENDALLDQGALRNVRGPQTTTGSFVDDEWSATVRQVLSDMGYESHGLEPRFPIGDLPPVLFALFHERVVGAANPVRAFNDHPDTTLADALLVCDTAAGCAA